MNVTFKQSLYGDFDGCSAGAFNLWYLNAPTRRADELSA
jgi:hypothetical protein